MASISSSFHCLSSSSTARFNSSFPLATRVTFQKIRPISAVCATAPVAERLTVSSSSFYEVLGVQSGATCKEIKAAYRRLARVLHPDVVGQNDVASDTDFIRVHEAYATLSDPGKRADYDRALFVRRRSVKGSTTYSSPCRSPSRFTRRSWETDQCW